MLPSCFGCSWAHELDTIRKLALNCESTMDFDVYYVLKVSAALRSDVSLRGFLWSLVSPNLLSSQSSIPLSLVGTILSC